MIYLSKHFDATEIPVTLHVKSVYEVTIRYADDSRHTLYLSAQRLSEVEAKLLNYLSLTDQVGFSVEAVTEVCPLITGFKTRAYSGKTPPVKINAAQQAEKYTKKWRS